MVTRPDQDLHLRAPSAHTLPEVWGRAEGKGWPAKLRGGASSHEAE